MPEDDIRKQIVEKLVDAAFKHELDVIEKTKGPEMAFMAKTAKIFMKYGVPSCNVLPLFQEIIQLEVPQKKPVDFAEMLRQELEKD